LQSGSRWTAGKTRKDRGAQGREVTERKPGAKNPM